MNYLFPVVILASSMAMIGTLQSPAKADDSRCYERWNLLYVLANERGEQLVETHQVAGVGLLEAFRSHTDGNWTIVYSRDYVVSCILASGVGSNQPRLNSSEPLAEFGI